MLKFGRKFKLIIELNPLILSKKLDNNGVPIEGSENPGGESNGLIIEPPITMRFAVEKSTNSSSINTAWIEVYNISESLRNQIFHDNYVSSDFKRVELQIGYDSLTTVFRGNIRRAFTRRNGPDIITYLDCMDGAFATINTKTSVTLQEGITTVDVANALISEFPAMQNGVMGMSEESINRPVVLEGNTWELLKTYTNQQCFIDSEKVHVLENNQVLEGSVLVIDVSSGLLDAPQREGQLIVANMLLEPGIVLGQIVKLQSTVQPEFDGQYKVQGIRHNGIISEAVNGACYTTVEMINDLKFLKGFQIVKPPSGAQ